MQLPIRTIQRNKMFKMKPSNSPTHKNLPNNGKVKPTGNGNKKIVKDSKFGIKLSGKKPY